MEERKSNKKTRGIIIAAMVLLLVAILCLCGTTFAKYITSTSVPTQQATVAKWGFVVSANADNLFGTEYKNGTKVAAGTTGVDVKSSVKLTETGTELRNVVAPGTSGSMKFHVTGSAEVQAALDLAMTNVKEIALKSDETTVVYNPVKWTLKTGDSETNLSATTDTTNKTLAELVAAVKKETTYAPGTPVNLYYELSWNWAIEADVSDITGTTEQDEKDKAERIATQDKYDTILGCFAQGIGVYGNIEIKADDVDSNKTVAVYTDAKGIKTTYQVDIKLAFDLSISVEQTQNKA